MTIPVIAVTCHCVPEVSPLLLSEHPVPTVPPEPASSGPSRGSSSRAPNPRVSPAARPSSLSPEPGLRSCQEAPDLPGLLLTALPARKLADRKQLGDRKFPLSSLSPERGAVAMSGPGSCSVSERRDRRTPRRGLTVLPLPGVCGGDHGALFPRRPAGAHPGDRQ